MQKTTVKLKKWGILVLILISAGAYSQNSIYFDGVDDYASAPNASGLVAGANGMSLSLWVYPKNSASAWPDFDGFAGFRNNSDADFYLMQLGPGDVEGRFRNSSGTTYTLSFNSMTMNAWNHFVLTYDGSSLILYHNGAFATSIAASGSISNTTTALDIGYLWYSTASNSFYLKGKLDNISLWKKALTLPEVTGLYNACTYDLADTNLVLCYEFNQGIAGGNNASITTLTDSKGNINGSLNNLTLNDTISNFSSGLSGNISDTISATSCEAYTTPSGNATYTASGTYHDTLSASNGCDSVLTILLTIDSIDTDVTLTNDTLIASAAGATYQWMDCSNNTLISGETGQEFAPSVAGEYAVIITSSGCTDTSECISTIGQNEHSLETGVFVYPNPAGNRFSVGFTMVREQVTVEIYSISGQEVWSGQFRSASTLDLPLSGPEGIYIVKISSQEGIYRLKVIKKYGH